MTIATGHPDFQDVGYTRSGNLFPSYSATLATGTYATAVIPVAQWSSLALNMSSTGGYGTVTIFHYADAAGTQRVGSDQWPVSGQARLSVITPLRSTYVQVTFQVTSVAAATVTRWCTFLSAPATKISFPVAYQSAGANGRVEPASSSDFYNLPTICAGTGFIKFVPADTLGKLRVRVIAANEAGVTLFEVANYGLPTAPLNQLIAIPDTTVILAVDNTDAGATHTYDVELTVPAQ